MEIEAPKGKYYEELIRGESFTHLTIRITKKRHERFNKLTRNSQRLHWDEEYARQMGYEGIVVNGLFILALVVETTNRNLLQETLIRNTSFTRIRHLNPVYLGSKIAIETQIMERRKSESVPDAGVVWLRHTGRIRDTKESPVILVERTVIIQKNPGLPARTK